jgi:hypoxanthine phosphoribosyltransferase
MTEEIRIKDKVFTELFSEKELNGIVSGCVNRVRERVGGIGDLVLIGVLNGGIPLFNEIAFSLGQNVILDYVRAASYGDGTRSSGDVKLLLDSQTDVKGKTVLLVDDIIDTGRTIKFLTGHFLSRGAEEVLACSLFYKRNDIFPEPEIFGTEIGDQFIVGYGLDYAGKGRNIKRILKLKE